MEGATGSTRAFSLLTLARSRRMLRAPLAWLLFGTVAVVYAFVALLVGGMLGLGPTAQSSTTVLILTSGSSWWNLPALIVITPNALLILPYFSTLAMVAVTIGVSLGMTVAVLLGLRLRAAQSPARRRSTAVSSTAGLTPVLIALVTLGACCSTTAAATAGIGLAAQSSGTSVDAVLAADWYLGVFQIVVLYVALLAQEELVEVYALFGDPEDPLHRPVLEPAPLGTRAVASAVLRLLLVAAGVTWALAAVAAWTTTDPLTASAASWADWILLHGAVSAVAISAGLSPRGAREIWVGPGPARWLLRGSVGLSGLLLLAYLPTPAPGLGLYGLANVLLGLLGASGGSGAVVPALGVGPALFTSLALQYGLLGAFALAVALLPERAFGPVLWSAARPTAAPAGVPAQVSPHDP
ncbi:MAG: hypothetical protein ACRECR_03970, partial [Thermoplasmata archaeon]